MFFRQIGKILRGRATPLQLMMAAILGAMLGFVPGLAQGPGLTVFLVLLLIILNANLAVAALVGLAAKIVSLLLLPLSFTLGRILLDGPTQPLFQWMINTPVLALFGFEYYATTGGIITGFVFGLVAGLVILSALTAFRRKMATLEEGSPLFQKYAGRWWVRLLAFIFIGGRHGKQTYAQILEKKIGNPIRVLGVVFTVLVIALLFVVQSYLSGPILTAALHGALERANGATVDLEDADVDLKAGRVTVTRLAMADPNALETDLLRASQLEADLSATDLLRKRVQFDRVVISEASSGETRASPGRLIGPAPQPSPPAPPLPDEKTIDDYITNAKMWKERLARVRKWVETLSGSGEETPDRETIQDRIKRGIRDSGYAQVTASHLITEAPTLTVTELIAEGVRVAKLEGEVLDIRAENISTHPYLLPEPPSISVKSRSGDITAIVRMKEVAGEGKDNRLRFTYLGLPVETISEQLAVAGVKPIQGGTMDVDLRGTWSAQGVGYLDLPLNVTLHKTTINLPQAGSAEVDELTIPLGLRGPMDNPRIRLDPGAFADALAAAGAAKLAQHVRGEADQAIDKAKKKLGEELEDSIGDKADGLLGDLLPGSEKPRKKKP